ncbi:glycosyltransferase family 2 protein [Alphaproteobacteria bacterium]|mgnify:CR=1 FL=1|nr:glycosyltransferase family 2 protein [Alphaproteobacteria bacterium]
MINNISIVIPVLNEERNIINLITEIKKNLEKKIKYEIIIVDDGSSDNTHNVLLKYLKKNKKVLVFKHKKNYGQSVSLRTGIMQTSSNYIVTLDGDGQNDPRDILKLLKNFETDKEFMMVIGNRVKRIDNFARRLASRSAFKIRKFILKDETPDTGCAIKVFKKEDFLKLPFFNHIHRFLPFLFNSFKGKVISIQVNHRARINGYSKYSNFQRFLVGISDIFGVIWLRKRSKWPINYEKVNNIKLIKRGKNGN